MGKARSCSVDQWNGPLCFREHQRFFQTFAPGVSVAIGKMRLTKHPIKFRQVCSFHSLFSVCGHGGQARNRFAGLSGPDQRRTKTWQHLHQGQAGAVGGIEIKVIKFCIRAAAWGSNTLG